MAETNEQGQVDTWEQVDKKDPGDGRDEGMAHRERQAPHHTVCANVSVLRYWKSEHDEQSCEDAVGIDTGTGLFVVADGVGTTLFSQQWAQLLVESFLAMPLLSNDPFEIDWWLRQVQERYQQHLPATEQLSWNALQKMQQQGSYATLATLRLISLAERQAQALALVFGDSCILHRSAHDNLVVSFPLERASDFDKAPICLPSKRGTFQRIFHRAAQVQLTLREGDTVILATDAVARWIVSAGKGEQESVQQAFDIVAEQTAASWPDFIEACRAKYTMVDDDSTALVLTFSSAANQIGAEIVSGTTTEHPHAVREARLHTFMQASNAHNSELIALNYGDGVDLQQEGVTLTSEEIQHARQVADAMQDVLRVLRQNLNSPDVATRMGPTWQRYSALLHDEPCAAQLRQTLARLGVQEQEL